MSSVEIPKSEYTRLVMAETLLETILQCKYKPVDQLQAVIHAAADTIKAKNEEGNDA